MRLILCFLLAVLPSLHSEARDSSANQEVEFLLHYIESSNASFIRNGTEYSAVEAANHLRQKLGRAGERVRSAEDFIDGIASQSYLSGKPYLIKTQDGKTAPTGPWLTRALTQHRQAGRNENRR